MSINNNAPMDPCYKCQGTGLFDKFLNDYLTILFSDHLSRDCKNSMQPRTNFGGGNENNYSNGGGDTGQFCRILFYFFLTGGATKCYNCNETGHFSRECPQARGGAGGGGGGDCYNCGQSGHRSAECSQPRQQRTRGECS